MTKIQIDPTIMDAIRAVARAKGRPVMTVKMVEVAAHLGREGAISNFSAARYEVHKEDNPPEIQPAIPEGHRLKGVSTLLAPDGSVSAQWVKTTAEPESPEEVLARLVRDLPPTVPVRDKITARRGPAPAEDLLAVYPMGDPHVGMLAWEPETGASFDLQIAEDLMVSAMRDLVLRGPRTRDAMIVNLGDFFHADNAAGHTTKGDHSLDLDGRGPKVLAAGMRIFTTLIDAAAEHHPGTITVDCRIGNHDGHTAIMLAIALAAYYRDTPRVRVPLPVAHRAYHEFGANLIGTTHGDRAKGNDLGAIMAAESPGAWGRTRHRVWYCGHVHHQSVKEYRGVRVETFRTLAARDSWHAGQGYTAGRDMHRITLHRAHGEVSREIVNVAALLGAA